MGRSFRLASRCQPTSCACAIALAVVLSIGLFPLASAFAARLGGAYYVDDAEIEKAGICEIESWSSFAANGDRISVFSPACVFNLGRPVELGTNLVNLRSGGEGDPQHRKLESVELATAVLQKQRHGRGIPVDIECDHWI